MGKGIKIEVKLKQKPEINQETKKEKVTRYGVRFKICTPKFKGCFDTGCKYESELGAVFEAHKALDGDPAFEAIVLKHYFDYILNKKEGRLTNSRSIITFTAEYLSQFVYSKEFEVDEKVRSNVES